MTLRKLNDSNLQKHIYLLSQDSQACCVHLSAERLQLYSERLFNLSDKEEVFKETSVKIVAVLAMSHILGNTGHSVPAPTPVYAA